VDARTGALPKEKKMKKLIKIFVITISLLSLFGCATTSNGTSNKPSAPEAIDTREVVEKQLSIDEKEIYNYVFTVLLQNNSSRMSYENGEMKKISTSKIVVANKTSSRIDKKIGYEKSSEQYKSYFESKMNSEYFEAYNSFIENNKTFNDISSFIQSDNRIITTDKLDELMGETKDSFDYWGKFYTVAPDACGKLIVSNIGFNSKNDIAVIEIKFNKSGMSGYTNYLIFGKKNNKWEVINVLQTVIS
jgi:hypothetical protein